VTKAVSDFFKTVPERQTVLILGPRGVGKGELCIDYMKYFLEGGGKIIFMITDTSPEKIKEKFLRRGVDLRKHSDRFIIIDCYKAWSSVGGGGGNDSIDSMPDIRSLKLSVEKAVHRLGKPVRIFIDSASTIFLYNDMDATLKFLRQASEKAKSESSSLGFTLHEGVHEEKLMKDIRSIVDGIIAFKLDDDRNTYIRYEALKGKKPESGWTAFRFAEFGIVFGEEKAR